MAGLIGCEVEAAELQELTMMAEPAQIAGFGQNYAYGNTQHHGAKFAATIGTSAAKLTFRDSGCRAAVSRMAAVISV